MATKEFPNNSDAAKEKKVEKVVSGEVKTRKQSEASKMAGALISDDAHNLGDYMLFDILIPAAKKAISDIVTDGIEILLYGETSGRKKRGNNVPRVSYNSYYERDRLPVRERSRERGYSYDDIVLESRRDAEEVLTSMLDILDNYGIVSVADLYELAGITGRYTDLNYGWTNLSSATVDRVRDGYKIRLPRAVPLN